jgi:hypothetical protein
MEDSTVATAVPEVTIGKGWSQITLKGEKTIEAAGWALPVLLVLRGLLISLTGSAVAGGCWLVLKWLIG